MSINEAAIKPTAMIAKNKNPKFYIIFADSIRYYS